LHGHSFDLLRCDTIGERRAGRSHNSHSRIFAGGAVSRFVDHDPNGMWNLCRQAVVFKGRNEADHGLWRSGSDGSNVGVAGGRVVRRDVDAACPTYDLAAIHRSLEGDARHVERFKVTGSHHPVPLHVPKQSLDVGGGWHN
jgi:hypothetical protein